MHHEARSSFMAASIVSQSLSQSALSAAICVCLHNLYTRMPAMQSLCTPLVTVWQGIYAISEFLDAWYTWCCQLQHGMPACPTHAIFSHQCDSHMIAQCIMIMLAKVQHSAAPLGCFFNTSATLLACYTSTCLSHYQKASWHCMPRIQATKHA